MMVIPQIKVCGFYSPSPRLSHSHSSYRRPPVTGSCNAKLKAFTVSPTDVNVLCLLTVYVLYMCVLQQHFEAWQAYDALIPALILCEADESRAKSSSSSSVWTKSAHLSLPTGVLHPPIFKAALRNLKLPV